MMLSRGNNFRWLRDAKLPDTTNHRSKADVAARATCPKNETFIGPGSWQSFEISSSKTVRAEGAVMLRRLADCQRPRYGGRGMLATQGKHGRCYWSRHTVNVSAISSWAEPARVRGRHVGVTSKKEPQMRQS
jgi:hypothetical protein